MHETSNERVQVPAGAVVLEALLALPPDPTGVVLFAHGSGSGRRSPRNNFVAGELRERRLGTLLVDLLTETEEAEEDLRFDIDLLSSRLGWATRFLRGDQRTAHLPLGLFGASTGAAAALRVAGERPDDITAVVSRGGRPDLAGAVALARVRAPTLLIVGGLDYGVIELNQEALALLPCTKQLAIVPHATHLFEEPGTLAMAARLATEWFERHLAMRPRVPPKSGGT